MIAFLVGNPYKPAFATFTGWGLIWICLKDVSNDFCLMGFGPMFWREKLFGSKDSATLLAGRK